MPTTRGASHWLHPKGCSNSDTRVCRNEMPTHCDHRLPHGPVQTQIRDDLAEFADFALEQAQGPGHQESAASGLLSPELERRIADAHLAADLLDADAQLRLLQSKRNLALVEFDLPCHMRLARHGPNVLLIAHLAERLE